eukprot:30953-Chlamydomonas_euryale.AAC.1
MRTRPLAAHSPACPGTTPGWQSRPQQPRRRLRRRCLRRRTHRPPSAKLRRRPRCVRLQYSHAARRDARRASQHRPGRWRCSPRRWAARQPSAPPLQVRAAAQARLTSVVTLAAGRAPRCAPRAHRATRHSH